MHMVDPSVHHPCHCGSGPYHPDPGPHGGNHQQADAYPAPAGAGSWTGSPSGGNRREMEGISAEKVRDIQKNRNWIRFLWKTPIGEEDTRIWEISLEDKETLSPDDYTNNQLAQDEINAVLQGLTERRRRCCASGSGCMMAGPAPWRKSAREFNVTRERIRQIEAKALRKLKHPTAASRLKDFVKS